MSKKAFLLPFLLVGLLFTGGVLHSHAAQATPAAPAIEVVAQSTSTPAELTLATAPSVRCGAMSCHSNDDCGFPDVCGGCIRSAGQWFGHCAPTP